MQGSLRALMDAEAPRLLSPDRALAVLSALSDELFPLHAAGRAHGPFGPAGITLSGGAAALTGDVAEPAYVAPELREGGEPSPATDAYSFATLAHELLAGGLPEIGEDGAARPLADAHPGFPAFAGEAIARGLQADPAARPLPKVLFTLLRVVPADRWPAASQPEPEPTPQPETAEPPTPEPLPATTPATTPAPTPEPEPALVAAGEPAIAQDEWHTAFAPVLDVPSIDWQAERDPTRPSEDVPAIAWSPDEEREPAPALTEVDDATFLHDFVDALRAPAEVPTIEPLDEAIPAGQMEHRPGRRVKRKRKERTRSPERLQKIVLLLILLVLVAVGAVWALTHKDGPRYDPQLQGASLSLSQPLSVRV